MARIRTIKPEFPQSETIGNLSRDARLLFIQLWTISDDSGRTRAASRMLASLLYPYDDDAPRLIPKWLKELADAGCIRLYEHGSNSYLDIPKWLSHQKIDRPSISRIPAFDEASRAIDGPSRKIAQDLGSSTKDLGEEEDRAFAQFALAAQRRKWPEPRKLDDDRRKKLRQRLAEHGPDGWRKMLDHAEGSEFINNKFPLKIDWVLEPKNFRKVIEGNYGAPAVATNGHAVAEEDWSGRVKWFRNKGMWNPMWGPKPGEAGCTVPKQYIAAEQTQAPETRGEAQNP